LSATDRLVVAQAVGGVAAEGDVVAGQAVTSVACHDVVPSHLVAEATAVLSLVLLRLTLLAVDLLAEEVALQVPLGPGEAVDLLGDLDGEKRGGDGDDGALHEKRSFPARYGQIGF
jgi:hypothetical protein